MKLLVIPIILLLALSNVIGKDDMPFGSNQAGPLNTNANSDVSSVETEMQVLEGELQEIESEIRVMENTNNNNMGLPNTELSIFPSGEQEGQSQTNSNNNQLPNSNRANLEQGLFPVIDVDNVINHITKHYKQNKFIMWIILGVAAFLALIACPSWVACCIGYCCFRRRQKARLQEKFSYDATSDSDEESGKPTSESLVRKLTMISQKRRNTKQRKGDYEPLKPAEDS